MVRTGCDVVTDPRTPSLPARVIALITFCLGCTYEVPELAPKVDSLACGWVREGEIRTGYGPVVGQCWRANQERFAITPLETADACAVEATRRELWPSNATMAFWSDAYELRGAVSVLMVRTEGICEE